MASTAVAAVLVASPWPAIDLPEVAVEVEVVVEGLVPLSEAPLPLFPSVIAEPPALELEPAPADGASLLSLAELPFVGSGPDALLLSLLFAAAALLLARGLL